MKPRAPTSYAEDMLLDYAVRLTHHRAGRKALFLPLSALAPESRDGTHWRLLESLFSPLILRHGGEFFRLRCGDAALVFTSADHSLVERLTSKLNFYFRDDPLLTHMTPPGAEPALCHWYDLGTGYERFLALTRRIKEAADDPAGPRSAQDSPDDAEPLRLAGAVSTSAPNGLDPRALPLVTWLQAPPRDRSHAPGAQGLSLLARVSPIMRWQANGGPEPFGELIEAQIDPGALGFPAGDLERNPELEAPLGAWIERRLLLELPHARPASSRLSVLARIETLLSAEFMAFQADWAAGSWVPVTWLVPLNDAEREAAAYRYLRETLKRSGHRLGLAGLTFEIAASLDLTRIKPDLVTVRWTADTPAPGSREARRLSAWLAQGGADVALLTGCDSRDSTVQGRALGFTHFEGRQAEALVKGVAAAG